MNIILNLWTFLLLGLVTNCLFVLALFALHSRLPFGASEPRRFESIPGIPRSFDPSGFPHRIAAKGREPQSRQPCCISDSAFRNRLSAFKEKENLGQPSPVFFIAALHERTLKEDICTFMGSQPVKNVHFWFVVECK